MADSFKFFVACLVVMGVRAQPGAGDADADPLAFFASLAELPPEQQDAFLKVAGKSMMDSNPDITCNIFGGEDSCQTISDNSEFANSCQAFRPDLRVDCAYYASSEDHLDMHPGDALNSYLGGAYNSVTQDCPQCLTSLQALWCVQALPECGSFQNHVHKAIFPAILAAKEAEDQGQPPSIAIAEAVPGLVEAMSKTMACKEMCEAAVSTCSCKADGSDILTFGEAILNAEKVEDSFRELGMETLGEDFRDTLFQSIWDKPVCDIFTSKDDPDFAGTCDEDVIGDNATCTQSGFCDDLDDDQSAGTETIIATQLARSVFAFIEGPAGILEQRAHSTEIAKNGGLAGLKDFKKPGTGVNTNPTTTSTVPSSDPATTTVDSSEDVTVEEIEVPAPTGSSGSMFGSIFGTLLLLVVLAGVGVFGWKKYQEYKMNQIGDYRPMDLDAYGDDGIPLQ